MAAGDPVTLPVGGHLGFFGTRRFPFAGDPLLGGGGGILPGLGGRLLGGSIDPRLFGSADVPGVSDLTSSNLIDFLVQNVPGATGGPNPFAEFVGGVPSGLPPEVGAPPQTGVPGQPPEVGAPPQTGVPEQPPAELPELPPLPPTPFSAQSGRASQASGLGQRMAKEVGRFTDQGDATRQSQTSRLFGDSGPSSEQLEAIEQNAKRQRRIEMLLGRFPTQGLGEQALLSALAPERSPFAQRRASGLINQLGLQTQQAVGDIGRAQSARGFGASPTTAFLQSQARSQGGFARQQGLTDILQQERQQGLSTLFNLLGSDVQAASVVAGLPTTVAAPSGPSTFEQLLAGGLAGIFGALIP